MDLYMLAEDGRTPVRTRDMFEWARWREHADVHVARTEIHNPAAERVEVSTVFLGIDHRFFGDGPPVLWETMVFGGPNDGAQARYDSRGAAMEGHEAMVLALTAVRAVEGLLDEG